MRGIGRPQIPVIIVIGTVLLNFFLDPLFIFGWKSVPAFGVLGAVMATIITQGIAAIIGLSILLGGKYGIHLKIKDFIPDFKFIKKAFFIGLPSSIEQSSRNLAMAFMISLVAGFGTTAVASYGAGSNIIQVAIFIGLGLAVANGTLVGQNIGANRIDEAVKVSKLSAVISFLTLSFLGIIVFIFSKNLVSFFIPNDLAVIQSGSTFIKIVALSFGFIGLHMSFANVFSAAGLTRVSMFLTVSSQWLFQIPLSYFLSQYTSLGLYGVWISIPFTNVFVSTVAFILYSRGGWKNADIIDRNKYHGLASKKVLAR
jgi:putative MATE family efflux protein